MEKVVKTITFSILASIAITGCGAYVEADYYTSRGMAVINTSGYCTQDKVQTWEDLGLRMWTDVSWVDPIDQVDAVLRCENVESYGPDEVNIYPTPDYTVQCYANATEIVLGLNCVNGYDFVHEFGHWALFSHSDVEPNNNLHHAIMAAVNLGYR